MKGSACQWGGVAMITPCRPGTSSSSRQSLKARGEPPCQPRIWSAALTRCALSTSQTATTSTPPALKAASVTTSPYQPQPITPSRILPFGSSAAPVRPSAAAPAASVPRNARRSIAHLRAHHSASIARGGGPPAASSEALMRAAFLLPGAVPRLRPRHRRARCRGRGAERSHPRHRGEGPRLRPARGRREALHPRELRGGEGAGARLHREPLPDRPGVRGDGSSVSTPTSRAAASRSCSSRRTTRSPCASTSRATRTSETPSRT